MATQAQRYMMRGGIEDSDLPIFSFHDSACKGRSEVRDAGIGRRNEINRFVGSRMLVLERVSPPDVRAERIKRARVIRPDAVERDPGARDGVHSFIAGPYDP